MTRLVLTLSLLVGVALAAAVGAVRVQPYQPDAALTAFLNPTGCAYPCLLGIELGVTTPDETIAILQTHPAVNWYSRERFGSYECVRVIWNIDRPAIIDPDIPGWVCYDNVAAFEVLFVSTVSFFEVRQSLGAFEHADLQTSEDFVRFSAGYPSNYLIATTALFCFTDEFNTRFALVEEPAELRLTNDFSTLSADVTLSDYVRACG